MWVHPRPEIVAVLWETLEENELAMLLKYRQSGFIGTKLLLGAAAAITKPPNFKIVLKKDNQHFTLATAIRKETIERHWRYLVDELIPQALQAQHESDSLQFIESRVAALASLEEGDEKKDEARIDEFHKSFPDLREDKVVTFYDCALWRRGKLTPTPGCVWLTHAHVCHQGKETTLLLVGNSIKITQSDDTEVWLVVFKRDQVYDVLERVWQQSMIRWQARIDPGAAPAVAASSSKGQLDLEKAKAKFKRFFKVPDDPVANFYGSYYRGGRQLVVGQIFISENFFCFKSKFGVSGTQISVRRFSESRCASSSFPDQNL